MLWLSCVSFGIRANIDLLKHHHRKELENITQKKKKIPYHHVFLHQRVVFVIFLLGARKLSYSCVSQLKKKKKKKRKKPKFWSQPETSSLKPTIKSPNPLQPQREKRDKSPSLPSQHTTTNKRPLSDLVKFFHEVCLAHHHHHLGPIFPLKVHPSAQIPNKRKPEPVVWQPSTIQNHKTLLDQK